MDGFTVWGSGPQLSVRRRIRAAIKAKLETSPFIWATLRANQLPLAHYYVHSQTGELIYAGYEWILEMLESLADEFVAA